MEVYTMENLPNAREVFYNEFKNSPNFMTPKIIRRAYINPESKTCPALVYELSSGKGIITDTIWGVTVLLLESINPIKTVHKQYLCNMFYSHNEAREYIEGLSLEDI